MTDEVYNLRRDFANIAAEMQTLQQRLNALLQNINVDTFVENSAMAKAKEYFRKRRVREQMFGNIDLFADPAWDILIYLFIAGEEDRDISLSSACIAAAVPESTAIRWINVLESKKHLRRNQDPSDPQQIYVSLTPATAELVRTYFGQ